MDLGHNHLRRRGSELLGAVRESFTLGDTSQIEVIQESTANALGVSWELDFFRNSAYECGLTGNYTFLVMNPAGAPDAEAPLWVYLHGGGIGY